MKSPTTLELLQRLSDDDQRNALVNSWPFSRCGLCYTKAATGLWMCQFSKQVAPYIRSELKLLCAACGMTDCYAKWNGFMSPKLLRCDLFLTITAPVGDKRTFADKLLEKIASHPSGGAYIRAWRLMFKPANIHNPIKPAQDMLVALVNKLFPPNDNKVE